VKRDRLIRTMRESKDWMEFYRKVGRGDRFRFHQDLCRALAETMEWAASVGPGGAIHSDRVFEVLITNIQNANKEIPMTMVDYIPFVVFLIMELIEAKMKLGVALARLQTNGAEWPGERGNDARDQKRNIH